MSECESQDLIEESPAPINACRDDSVASQKVGSKCNKFVIVLDVVAVLVCLSLVIILTFYWKESATLLTEFGMGSENAALPVLVSVGIFASVIAIVCIVDLGRRSRKLKSGTCCVTRGCCWRRKRGDYSPMESQVGNVEGEEFPKFLLRPMMLGMSQQALMEVGLLAKNTAEEARISQLHPQGDGNRYGFDCISEYKSGFSFQVEQNDVPCHILRATVVFAGSTSVGKTSIFSRVVHDKYSSDSIPTEGIDFGLKSLGVSGRTVFDRPVRMDLGMHIWDTPGNDTATQQSLKYFRNHVILIVICDVTDKASVQGAIWWVTSMRSQVYKPHVALFLNKIDLEDRMLTAEDFAGIPTFEDVPIFEVSAKTGEGVMTSFTEVVCRAVCYEAEQCVLAKTLAEKDT